MNIHIGLEHGPIYLDYNATTPIDPVVVEAMLPKRLLLQEVDRRAITWQSVVLLLLIKIKGTILSHRLRNTLEYLKHVARLSGCMGSILRICLLIELGV